MEDVSVYNSRHVAMFVVVANCRGSLRVILSSMGAKCLLLTCSFFFLFSLVLSLAQRKVKEREIYIERSAVEITARGPQAKDCFFKVRNDCGIGETCIQFCRQRKRVGGK